MTLPQTAVAPLQIICGTPMTHGAWVENHWPKGSFPFFSFPGNATTCKAPVSQPHKEHTLDCLELKAESHPMILTFGKTHVQKATHIQLGWTDSH